MKLVVTYGIAGMFGWEKLGDHLRFTKLKPPKYYLCLYPYS